MRVIRRQFTEKTTESVIATIGNFDGMHLGHQAIMARIKSLAEEHSATTCVVTFQPLPHEVFAKDNIPGRIHGTRDRLTNFKNNGIDHCFLLSFNQALQSLSADEFIEQKLLRNLNLHTLVVGDDFKFGNNRSGNFETLVNAGKTHGFNVEDTPTVLHENERVSSTRIRTALQANDLDTAATLLGRAYRISGRVVHGEKVGRQLGFPTANIALKQQVPPLQGVFGVIATCNKTQQSWPAVANLGKRPTVGGLKLLLEVHLLNATEDLYGKHLSIDFLHFIRGEKKFASLDELKAQIQQDAQQAEKLLNS